MTAPRRYEELQVTAAIEYSSPTGSAVGKPRARRQLQPDDAHAPGDSAGPIDALPVGLGVVLDAGYGTGRCFGLLREKVGPEGGVDGIQGSPEMAPTAIGGGKWAAPWMVAVNLLVMIECSLRAELRGIRPAVESPRAVLDDANIRELAFGSAYIMTGRPLAAPVPAGKPLAGGVLAAHRQVGGQAHDDSGRGEADWPWPTPRPATLRGKPR